MLQESFVNVWHHAGSYVAARSQPLTWLTSIVRNRCLDRLRKHDVDTVSIDDEDHAMTIADRSPLPLDLLLSGAEAGAVRRCVDALDAGQKQAMRWRSIRACRIRARAAPQAAAGTVVMDQARIGAPGPASTAPASIAERASETDIGQPR